MSFMIILEIVNMDLQMFVIVLLVVIPVQTGKAQGGIKYQKI